AEVRIPGVLQRIGVTYLAAAFITVDASDVQQWLIACGLLVAHWIILVAPLGLPSSGLLEPGHNVGASLDRALFGSHLFAPAGDPEGVLGLLGCISTALFGAAVGRWVLRRRQADGASVASRPSRLVLIGGGCAAIVLAYGWSFLLPLNKALWTPSFA